MKSNKLKKQDEATLLRMYKTHVNVAAELGISYRRWCQIRDTRELSKRIKIIIDLKTQPDLASLVETST